MIKQMHTTPLAGFHAKHKASMTDFAGWSMPLKYAGGGFLDEHMQTRTTASLFDVSHMCQIRITGTNREQALDRVLPIACAKLKPNRNKYSFALNAAGGIIDDLIIGNEGDEHFIVCNASRAEVVITHLKAELGKEINCERMSARALLAVQGPAASSLVAEIFPQADELFFMESVSGEFAGLPVRLCRCGYTGEDGFEIAAPASVAVALAERLVSDSDVCAPAGLVARDTLRLEACLCLYGNDLTEEVTPVEAGLRWAIAPSVRATACYLGAAKVKEQLEHGCARTLVALEVAGKSPVRQGASLRQDGAIVGKITSGGFSPTLGKPVAIGFVDSELAVKDAVFMAELRAREVACTVITMPFVKHNYRMRPKKQ